MHSKDRTHIVIVGAGFAGLNAAKVLARDPRVFLTIIDMKNHHLFQPLLYQVAMAELNTADIAFPIRGFFRHRRNVEVILAEALQIDLQEKTVHTTVGAFSYDYLLLAAGSRHTYYGYPEWEEFAPGLKTLEQAAEIRRRVLLAFELAELSQNADERTRHLTFVIVGGGPTGVELAGAIGEMANVILPKEYRHVDTGSAKILLLEGGSEILNSFAPSLIRRAHRDLQALGVEVRTGTFASALGPAGIRTGDEWIPASTVLWAAGVAPSPLGKQLGVPTDKAGRVSVAEDLSLPGHREVFVAGDLASVEQHGAMLPGVAPVALQQGVFIGKTIRGELSGGARGTFVYSDKGSMATIGHNKAIAQIGKLRLVGYPAWLAWVFVHIYYLSGFKNRVFVLMQWAWAYFTRRRSMRIIIERNWRFYGGDDLGGKG